MALISIFAEANVQLESFLAWFLRCAGVFGVAELLAGVVVFLGAVVVVCSNRRAAILRRYLLVVQLPLLIAVLAAIARSITYYGWISRAPDAEMKSALYADYLPDILSLLKDGFLISLPSYFVVGVGLLVRMRGSHGTSQQDNNSATRGISNN
jgi:hypothetical protein